MHVKLAGAIAIGLFAVGFAPTANAQRNPPTLGVDLGASEFDAHCATCHGPSGAGGGPYASSLNKKAPDLTTLSRTNGGVFPFARVYETIDGRQDVQAHGTRDMPIWGRDFMASGGDINPYYDREAFVRAKILALTEYIYRLQLK